MRGGLVAHASGRLRTIEGAEAEGLQALFRITHPRVLVDTASVSPSNGNYLPPMLEQIAFERIQVSLLLGFVS